MKKTVFSGILLAGMLSGCTPMGMTTSEPARAVMLSGLSANLPIEAAAACSWADGTYATVRFENGDRGHYQVFEDRVEQVFMMSEEQYMHFDMPKSDGCFSYQQDYLLTKSLTGETQFYVSKDLVFDQPFGPETKQKLLRFSNAVKVAIADYAKFVPPENSWR